MLFSQLRAFLGAVCVAWSLGAQAQDTPDIKVVPLRTHSLASPYLDANLQSRWWDYGGDAIVRADKYVRLTSDRPSQSGWLFSRVPLTATNWEIEVEFSVNGHGNLFGDGMAIWVTKQRGQEGTVFGSQDKFEGLGIFIDTYKNNRPGVVFPYVMAMLGDGQTTYDQEHDGKENELAGCSVRGLRNQAFPTKLKITYFQEKSLKVEMMYKREDEWTECFDVPGVKLPQVTYLGFSAHTGELSDNHDIVKVETSNLYSPSGQGGQAQKEFSKNKYGNRGGGTTKKTSRGSGRGWTWFLLKFVFFGLALTGAYVGFTVYRARQRDRF